MNPGIALPYASAGTSSPARLQRTIVVGQGVSQISCGTVPTGKVWLLERLFLDCNALAAIASPNFRCGVYSNLGGLNALGLPIPGSVQRRIDAHYADPNHANVQAYDIFAFQAAAMVPEDETLIVELTTNTNTNGARVYLTYIETDA